MTDHDPRAWRIAIALAHATGLDWARWAKGEETRGECSCAAWCEPEEEHHEQGCAWLDVEYQSPVPAPWDTDAYLADCRRREVEPGPLSSLEWTGPDGFGWKVDASHERICRVRVDFVDKGEVIASWYSRLDVIEWREYRTHRRALVERIANLARVAAEAMR